MADIEEIFKVIVSLIVFVILMGALAPLLGESNIFGLSSFIIGFAFLAVILAVLIKILNEFGIGHGI